MAESHLRMIRRRFSWLQKAVALAPALLLLVCLPGQMLLRCRIDGLLRTACCCAPDGEGASEDESQGSGPVIRAQDCCDQVATQSHRPAAEAARSSSLDFAPVTFVALAASPAPIVTPPAERLARIAQRHGPPREGPRLIVLKQAFLI